jgi:hypothetical protein
MSLSKEEVKDIDYLIEDPIINNQRYVCLSFLKPSNIDEENRDKNLTVSGVKVGGSYETYEDAKKRAEFLQKHNKYHNIYIGEVGKWCPFEDNPDKAKDCEYMNKDLNKLMKTYLEQQEKAKEYHETRKQDMVKKAVESSDNQKKLNKINENKEENESGNKKKNKLDKIQKKLETEKKDLEYDKNEVTANINKIRELEEELAEKIKELEANN